MWLMASSALAISVAALAVAWLTMSVSGAIGRRMDSLATRVAKLDETISKTSNATLRAEVDDLAGALDVVKQSNRREFGALWGRLGGKSNGRTLEAFPLQQDEASDAELAALIALQKAPPKGPGA